MITYDFNQTGFTTAFKEVHRLQHPDETEDAIVERCRTFYNDTEALLVNFYEDGIHIATMALLCGLSLHYGVVMNVNTITISGASISLRLGKAMLRYAKDVCREAGIQYLTKSTHLSNNTERVTTIKI